MALTDTAGGTQTDPGTGKPSENPPADPPSDGPASEKPHDPPADPNKPTPPKEETPPGAPEKYAFTAPEGQELDTSALAQFEPVARELNLTQEQAQKLVDVYPKVLAGVQQQQAESWQKQTEDWAAAVKADKDIGGDKLASNLGAAPRAIDTFGTKELKEYLDGTCARSLVNVALRRKRSGKPCTYCYISAFYFTGCGLHCRKALLPRDRKPAPESTIFRTLHPTSASL